MQSVPATQIYHMVVESINASCESRKMAITRRMRLVDQENFDNYHTEVSMSLPAIEGVGTGDVLAVTVNFQYNAIEHELLRAAALNEEE